MTSRIAKAKKTISTTSSTTIKEEKENKPPEGSRIIERSVRTETRQIENGWLITKSYSGRYIPKGSEDKYGNYFDYNKVWYSKEDPLTITLNDKSLADAFEED